MHIALTPAFITGWALQDAVEAMDGAPDVNPESTAEILAAHDESVTKAKAAPATRPYRRFYGPSADENPMRAIASA